MSTPLIGCTRTLAGSVLVGLLIAGCTPDRPEVPWAEPGEPLPDLSEDERARFAAGAALFGRVFGVEEGVGPLFNENQCSACHTFPANGGTGEQLVLKASRFEAPDRCDPLAAEGGENLRRRVTPALAAHGVGSEPVPAGATERGRFIVPFLYGLGLAEAIDTMTLLAQADPDDADGDGISGRVGRDRHGRVARFGHKADVATLEDFTESALRFEMGLSTARFPTEPLPARLAHLEGIDPAPEPEVDARTVALLTDFVRFLAPLRPRPAADAAEQARIDEGEALFQAVGCARCHTPELRTGRHESAALDRRRVRLYSDLLLHDLGEAFANVCSAGATPTELRTAPLTGIGHREVFLHDGRARTIRTAILAHGGEAQQVRDAFAALPRTVQELLLRFLATL